jgi:type I restriction enzyme M protein
MHLLKEGGRGAIVLPDGTLFGEGVKTRIKEKLLEECDLHTIVRLPNGVFSSYTGIKTNLLFFTKGKTTKEIWFYEHPYPNGVKSYNKTKPIRIEEFEPEKAWWHKREKNERAWKVSIDEIKAGGYNLDIKNPIVVNNAHRDPEELLADAPNDVKMLRELILQLAVRGKLVAQDEKDEPVTILLEELKTENGKKIKKSETLPSIYPSEIGFKIAAKWSVEYLGNIAHTITKGATPTS